MTSAWLGTTVAATLTLVAYTAPARAEACVPTRFVGAFSDEKTLCQNWTADDQQTFWFLSQGSQIIPYSWFLVLEQAGSETLFRDPAHMDRLRYLPQRQTPKNLDGLPIGFTKDSARGNDAYGNIADDWLGMNCAACHTGQIEFNGSKMLIDGAPTMADFEGFVGELAAALRATLEDSTKFDRFVDHVLGPGSAASDAKEVLRGQLQEITETREAWNERNKGFHPYGFARLDAIGSIFNEIAVTAIGLPGNAKPANAPVSYPFIWDAPQHDVVQWNGSVPNKGAGALGRNIGEVLGVFGALTLNTGILPHQKTGHKSSVDIKHLGQIEELLWKLQSPQWPAGILPAIDDSNGRLSRGKQVFDANCVSCHADIRRDDPHRQIKAELTPLSQLGTDRMMAANFAERVGRSGDLKGRIKTYVPTSLDRFGPTGSGVEFLRHAVTGVIVYNLLRDPGGTHAAINAGRDPGEELVSRIGDIQDKVADQLRMAGTPEGRPASQLFYKARPLNGIWATAPYLHNGSVPTLADLLEQPDKRPKVFKVGSREFDPVKVGFRSEGGFLLDTTQDGNHNDGHSYGTTLSEPDKAALLEYLKTL
jgi:hypothetical protein